MKLQKKHKYVKLLYTTIIILTVVLSISTAIKSENFTRVIDPLNQITTANAIEGYWTGCNWVDYDHDGDLDFFAINRPTNNATRTNLLFQNDGLGNFIRITSNVLVQTYGWWFSATWGDYDNDGDIDCYVSGFPSRLFVNDGSGNFTAVGTADLVGDNSQANTVGWADYDNDGNLDLCQIGSTHLGTHAGTFISPPRLFHNNGAPNYDFTLVDTGAIYNNGSRIYISLNWTDYDMDGDQDLFVGSGGATPIPDNMFKNMLKETGAAGFIKLDQAPITTDSALGQQWSFEDMDNDGDLDGFWSSWRKNSAVQGISHFYINDNGTYIRNTTDEIVTIDSSASSANVWGDYDNDGDIDCIVTTDLGYRLRYYRNNGDATFTAVLTGDLPTTNTQATGASVGDYDNDGDLDFVTVGPFANTAFFRNDNFNGNNWKKITLEGTQSNRSAIGARVFVLATISGNPVWQQRELSASNTYLGHNALILHFGLGDATSIDTVRVHWPNGAVQNFTGIPINTTDTLTECTDSDLDGICDYEDACPNDPFNDIDGDGICGDIDACPNDSLNDIDGDGVCGDIDNCPETPNPLQEDIDNDNIGDVCDICCIFLRGNVDSDPSDLVDISDLVFLVDFMFSGGTTPLCLGEANVDGDVGDIIDISDLVYLVEFMFNSGPAPSDCEA